MRALVSRSQDVCLGLDEGWGCSGSIPEDGWQEADLGYPLTELPAKAWWPLLRAPSCDLPLLGPTEPHP